MSKKEKEIVDNTPVQDFKELVERYKKFGSHVAFQHKQRGEIVDITYEKFAEDIRALRNSNIKHRSRKSSNNRK